jgi:5-formyltetrahydrofolate cyclo-ligase
MWRVDTEEKKRRLRKRMLAQRGALTPAHRSRLSQAIQSRALQLPIYQAARVVVLYSAAGGEVSTQVILTNALASGRRIFYPRTAADGSGELIAVGSQSDLRAGRYGTREPSGSERLCAADCGDLVMFVPGLAFDRSGNRLGRGQGWYDRILSQLSINNSVALAYEFQVMPKVPVNEWDQKVQYVITENSVIHCGSGKAVPAPIPQTKAERGCFN